VDPSSGDGRDTYSVGTLRELTSITGPPTEYVALSPHLRIETDPLSKPLLFRYLEFQKMDKVQKHGNFKHNKHQL
jgi:hypothetical protein